MTTLGLHAELTPESGTSCKVCRYLRTLPTAEAADWTRELALPVTIIGNAAVVRALARRDVKVEEASVRRHRSNHASLR